MTMNPRKERFALEYAVGEHAGNAKRSAIAAGYSPDSAHTQGYRLINDDEVVEAIEAEKERVVAPIRVTASEILARAWEIAQSDEKDRVAALSVAAKAFPEFKDAAIYNDNRQVNLSGLTDEQLEALAAGNKHELS